MDYDGFQSPIGSMYGIYANIWGILMVNVTIYNIHGSYGSWNVIYMGCRQQRWWFFMGFILEDGDFSDFMRICPPGIEHSYGTMVIFNRHQVELPGRRWNILFSLTHQKCGFCFLMKHHRTQMKQYIYIYIWVNLITTSLRPHWESWLVRGIIPTWDLDI